MNMIKRGDYLEKAILLAINERLYRLGLIDENTKNKVVSEINTANN